MNCRSLVFTLRHSSDVNQTHSPRPLTSYNDHKHRRTVGPWFLHSDIHQTNCRSLVFTLRHSSDVNQTHSPRPLTSYNDHQKHRRTVGPCNDDEDDIQNFDVRLVSMNNEHQSSNVNIRSPRYSSNILLQSSYMPFLHFVD